MIKIFVQPRDSVNHGSNLIAYSAFSTVTLVAIIVSILGLIMGYPPVIHLVTTSAVIAAGVGYILWNSGYPALSTSIHFSGLILAGLLAHTISGTIGGAAGILYLAAVITSGGLLGWKGVKYGIPIIICFAAIGALFHAELRVLFKIPESYQVTEALLLTFVFSSIPCWGAYVVLIDVSNRRAWRKALLTNQALLAEQEQLKTARFQQAKLIELGLMANSDISSSTMEQHCRTAFVDHVPDGLNLWRDTIATKEDLLRDLLAHSKELPIAYQDFVKGLVQILKTTYERERLLQEKEVLSEEWQREKRLTSLARMAGGVAHDFNNFLMVIMALADSLSGDKGLSERQYKSLETILLTTQHASEMTRQLMYFSRGISLKETVVNLTDVIERSRPIFSQIIPEYVALDIAISDSNHGVLMPANQIERIVLNLIRNSLSAIPVEHHNPTISLAVDFQEKASHPKLHPHPSVLLSVSDNGQGMDAETLERAIEPYFSKNQSSGLGLSTVHGLVEYLGGALEITSILGQGTNIDIYFPAHSLPVDDDTEPTQKRITNNNLVLLIDDEVLVRQSVSLFLENLGWTVLEAGNGEDAMRAYHSQISFIVCDVRLGTEIGFTVVQQLRTQGFRGPVLYITGFTGKYDEHLAKNEKLIGKPFRFQEFKTAIADLGFVSQPESV